MSNEYKITIDNKIFSGSNLKEAVDKAKAYHDSLQKDTQILPSHKKYAGTYNYNSEYDSIEIHFCQKPERFTLDQLSSNGWRWHGVKKCWYAKRTPQNIRIAEVLCAEDANNPEQQRQKAILALREKILYWLREYDSYTIEQLLALPEKLERRNLYSSLPKDYLRQHNIDISPESDIAFLRSIKKSSEEFESQCRHMESLVHYEAVMLLETAYWYQLGLHKAKTKTLHYTEPNSSIDNSPVKLKESSFWENFQLYNGNLQPVDIARRMGFSYSEEDYIASRNPRIESLALIQVQQMPTPAYNFSIDEKELAEKLSVLYHKGDQWRQICRKYCLEKSAPPLVI